MADEKTGQPVKKTSIGGQALIEGIMMRGPERTAMAVRHVSGEIILEDWATSGQNRAKIWKLPLLRGIYGLVDSMRFGYKCLMRSAELSGLEDDEPTPKKVKETAVPECESIPASVTEETVAQLETAVQTEEAPAAVAETTVLTQERPVSIALEAKAEEAAEETGVAAEAIAAEAVETVQAPAQEKTEKKESVWEKYLMSFLMVISSVLGVALAVFLFIWLPAQLTSWLTPVFPAMGNRFVKSAFEGILKILLFIGYVSVVSLMKDIRRVFMYHGAEHKTIFCYENGLPLTVENIRKQSRFHPRCGTSFMILMLLVGILVGMFIPANFNSILRSALKILLLPLSVGIGYELIKLAGRKDNLLTKIISAPGLWVQRITTKEPDDDMIECAIAAMNKVIPDDPEADKW